MIKLRNIIENIIESDREDFLRHHYTGYIGMDAYKQYRTEKGLEWLANRKYPKLLEKKQHGPYMVEYRQTGETMLGGNEDQTVVAFIDGKPIGWASNEFGAVGVWVVEKYQKLGIGTELMEKHIEQRPEVKSGKSKIGQMTPAGQKLTMKYYDKMVAKHGPDWFKKPLTESFRNKTALEMETEKFRKSLIQQYPQLEDLFFNIGYRPDILHLSFISIKKEFRDKGIGKQVISAIKSFADTHGLIITLSPEATRGYKKKLDNYYKSLGFIHNRGRKKDYALSSFFGPTMLRRPETKKLTESFELPPEMDVQSEKLAQFIASLFLTYLKEKLSDTEGKSNDEIVDNNEDYRLATKYKNEGKQLFGVIKHKEITDWGEASLRIYSKNDILPDTILFITNGYHSSNDGYMYSVEDPQGIAILVNKNDFIKFFKKSTEELIDTVKHEIRHWYQSTEVIGLPKTKILGKNVDVMGTALKPTFFGYVTKQPHHLQDIEFKTNLHTYAFHIKRYLNKNIPKSEWKKEFNDMVSGKPIYTGNRMMDTILDNIEHMMKKDLPRWRQFVKELYKLIFKND